MTKGGTAGRRDGGRGLKAALRGAVVACVLFPAVPPSRLPAQSSPRLVEAVRLAQAGRSDSAHAVVSRLLASTPPADSLYPEVLYTMGLVSGDLDEMQRYFQRVVVEHSTSRWADVSLYRLAQIAYVREDWTTAARQLDRIRSDYPTSTLLPRAAFWAAQIYAGHRHDLPAACRWVADGLAHAASDAEMQKSLGAFQEKRCRDVAVTGRDSVAAIPASTTKAAPSAAPAESTKVVAKPVAKAVAKPDSAKPTPRAPAVQPSSRSAEFQVQVAAMATPAQAADVVEKLKAAGFDAAVVTEKGFYKVRVGGYATAAEAAEGARAIKAKLGGAPYVVRS